MGFGDLDTILNLVGELTDEDGDNTPRERFRRYLIDEVAEVGQVRDYIEECLRKTGTQYNRALQDLVNYIGRFLGFDVRYGLYSGRVNSIGFDGHWVSHMGFHIVAEVKTTEVYSIKTAALVGYIDSLISRGDIPDWDSALGLYMVGRPDPEMNQLENSIVAEKRINQLRIISVESLLSLAELMNEYDVSHEDVLSILRPSGPVIDPVIELMSRVVAQEQESVEDTQATEISMVSEDTERFPFETESPVAYWLTPVKSTDEETAIECIEKLVGKESIYAFGERTPGRKRLKIDDGICFYATGIGVIAHARVASRPEKLPNPEVRQPEDYPWTFRLTDTHLYVDNPIVIDAELRSRLEKFSERDPNKSWAWFVQATNRVSASDFRLLTRKVD